MKSIEPGEGKPQIDIQRAYRIRIGLFLAAVALGLPLLVIFWQFAGTLVRLNEVEIERDHWQRAADVIQALNPTEGHVVVDLGCGSGYFALKLSPAVGSRGRVLAEDIRAMALLFLWTRARLQGRHNIRVRHVSRDAPDLPEGAVDGVLVANTFHELSNAGLILNEIYRSLRQGGRLVILDRGPRPEDREGGDMAARHHEMSAEAAVDGLRESGFRLMSRQDDFIDQPGNGRWWLLVAQKP